MRGHQHWGNQGRRKRRDDACFGGGLVCTRGMVKSNIYRGVRRRKTLDQEQKGVITVSQGDRLILKGERCEGLYKLKEGNSVRGGV